MEGRRVTIFLLWRVVGSPLAVFGVTPAVFGVDLQIGEGSAESSASFGSADLQIGEGSAESSTGPAMPQKRQFLQISLTEGRGYFRGLEIPGVWGPPAVFGVPRRCLG